LWKLYKKEAKSLQKADTYKRVSFGALNLYIIISKEHFR